MVEEYTDGTMAQKIRRRCVLSLDFEMKDSKKAYASTVGGIEMDKFRRNLTEVMSVHRSSINGAKGYMKIQMKVPINVNRKFDTINEVVKDEN